MPAEPPRVLLVVWTSTTGGTRQMVDAAAHGAHQVLEHSTDNVEVRVRHALDAVVQDVLDAAAVLIATPEHLGSMAGQMKMFFDKVYYPCLDRVAGRVWAPMVCAGTDGQGTVRQLQRIATGLRLRAVGEPLIILTHAHSAQDILAPKSIAAAELEKCAALGGVLAAGLASGLY